MPWVAPITGYADRLGYVRCVDHAPPEHPLNQTIYGDNGAYHGVKCDFCDFVFPEIRTKDYVQVSHDSTDTPLYRRPARHDSQ